jgi:hypothetical protein
MNAKWEDDGLSWAGDDDPTLEVGHAGQEPGDRTHEEPASETATSERVLPEATATADQAEARQAMGSIALLGTGILIGVYLLYTIGWFIGVSRIENPLTETVARFMFSLSLWFAVAAPALWFATVSLLSRGRPRVRFSWLLIGVLVLAPLPFILEAGAL